MAEITAATVKELRERTGAGMMDCKKALGETHGDMEAAIDWLRTKGLAAAAKKAGRTAAEGLVGVAVDGNGARRRGQYGDRLRRQERAVPGVRAHRRRRSRSAPAADVEGLLAPQWPGGGTVEEKLTANIATIGENQSLRRVGRAPGRARAWSSPTSTMPSRRASARSACWSRSRATATRPRSRRSASSSPCTSPRPTRWR